MYSDFGYFGSEKAVLVGVIMVATAYLIGNISPAIILGRKRNIDIKKEQELILKHDNIIFEFPLYWYSSPPILKKWLDDVLSFNWAYGNEYRLKGKNIGFAVSVGGPETEYSKTGYVKFSMNEILIPFEATVEYIKANLISHYILFDAIESLSEEKLLESTKNYVKHIFSIK
mgnify:CR=1 FL=1